MTDDLRLNDVHVGKDVVEQRGHEVLFSAPCLLECLRLSPCSVSFTPVNHVSITEVAVIIIIEVIFIAPCLTDKDVHTALYKINNNVYIKPQK